MGNPEYTELFICADCGSLQILVRDWVSMNTGEVMSSCCDDDVWCPRCQDHRYCEVLYRESGSNLWTAPAVYKTDPPGPLPLRDAIRWARELNRKERRAKLLKVPR